MVFRQRAARERRYFPQQLRFLRIHVRLADSLEPILAIDDVERAVIGNIGYRQAHQRRERGLVIERSAEHAAGLGQQGSASLRALGFGACCLLVC